MTLSVDDDINRMSQDVYKSFFLSLDEGKSLDSFLTTWSNLECLVGSHQHQLKPATLQMVRSLADVVGTVASSFLQLGDFASQIVRDTEDEVTRIFKGLLIEDPICKSTDSKVLSQYSHPPYVKMCYRWLMKNLHNPYPSKATRQRIAKEGHSATRDVEKWFADTRKRIGWNDLRRRSFANRKDFIIKAATQFFKPASGLVNVELLRYNPHFASVLASAENLYSGELLTDLDSFPTNSRTNHCATALPSATAEAAALQYPSPASSPNSSTTSLPLTVSAPTRKRRISEDSLLSESESDLPPRKLARSSIPMELAITSLPSPAPSSLDLDRSDFAFVDESNIGNPASDKLIGKRKRCVSDSDFDLQPDTKRLHTADHHISPYTTIESSFPDQLIQSLVTNPPTFCTAIPGPVTVEAIDSSSNVEISIFDFDPGHCVSDHLTDIETPYGFLHRDPALSTDFDLFFANLQGDDLSTLNLDIPVLPDSGNVSRPLSPRSLQLVPRSPQPPLEWMSFYPGYTLDVDHHPDTLRTSIFANRNFSCSAVQTPKLVSLPDLGHLETVCYT